MSGTCIFRTFSLNPWKPPFCVLRKRETCNSLKLIVEGVEFKREKENFQRAKLVGKRNVEKIVETKKLAANVLPGVCCGGSKLGTKNIR